MHTLLTKLAIAVLATGTTLAGAGVSQAQSGRPNSTTMTCAQVQALINQRGAAVISTGRYTFDRYVANRNFCQHGEVLYKDYIPTRDTNRCYVQRCQEFQRWRFD
ncbi:hypothetical protein [Roseibium sp. Sym1]|uniref:hypothetical protein n=1 Tax=Roseibium sp. Sym1 TaxID=3016006 RepID=UPI0022B3885D|nr:hypothetical protein [Roseibium sp. Sym1]